MLSVKEIIRNPAFKKSMSVVGVAFTGVSAVADALAEKKKDAEFEELKKTVAELKTALEK